jgi:drug/metabolite transporter (DMT)-like permease
MMWVIYALLTAVFNSLKNVSSKKGLRSLDEYVVSWFIYFLPAVFILFYFLFVEFPHFGPDFYPVLILDCILSVIATLLSMKALLKSDLSIVMPMTAFTPLFMLGTSYVMLGEFPDSAGCAGVVLIVVGTYFLNIKERRNGWIMPFKALVREDGPKLMLGAAFIWSITGGMDKIAVRNSSPVFFAMAENLLMAAILFPFAWKRICRQRNEIRKERFHLAAVGIFSALMTVFQMLAVSQALVVYVVAIKRLAILFSIILGGLIFKEKNIGPKLAGGAIMVLGVLLITF